MWRLFLVVLISAHLTSAKRFFLTVVENLQDALTPKCQQQVEDFLSNFTIDENSWALQMVDASSKIPSGLLNLNFGEMGDFDQCVQIHVSTAKSGDILGKYCLGYVSFGQNTNTTTNNPGSIVSTSAVPLAPIWSLCLPNECTTDDASKIGKALLESMLPEVGLQVTFPDFLCQTMHEVDPELTGGAIAAIIVFTVLTFVVLVCSWWDIYSKFYGDDSSPMIIKGFSLYTNSMKIFRTTTSTSDQIPCLNGLKFFSMMWVVVGHQFSIPIYGSITNTKYLIQWADNLYSMFLVSGTLSVDTFFTIGGTLMAYGFMKAMVRKVRFNIFLYYLHRYLRLTAPFALVVLFSATLLKYTGSGPKWPYLTMYFQKNCEEHWWSALLYIQNYVNISNMCVGQTWYLNIDMQLYIISPLIFFGLWKFPKTTLTFLSMCSLVFIALSFYESWDHNLSAIISNLYSTNKADFDNKYYLVTHTRSTPWIIGILLGYLLFKIKQKEISFKIHRTVTLVLWIICFVVLLTCVLCGHSTLRSPEYDRLGNALHIALIRPLWSVAIAWIILACANNYGGPVNWILSLPIFQVLNRFTYGIYLTHVTLLYAMAYGRKWPDYFTGFNMAYQFWGTLWFSTGLAAILVFLTESPIIVLEKILLGAFTRKSTKRDEDPEKGVDNATFQK